MPTLRSSLRTRKAALTRIINTIDQFIADNVVATTLSKATTLSNKLDEQYEKVEDAFGEVIDTEPDDADKLYEDLEAENARFNNANSRLNAHVKSVEASIAAANASSASTPRRVDSSFSSERSGSSNQIVEKSLKPFTITKDHSPQELRRWLVQFMQYYNSGKLSQQPLEVQRGFFDRCIGPNLLSDMAVYIKPTTGIIWPRWLSPDP